MISVKSYSGLKWMGILGMGWLYLIIGEGSSKRGWLKNDETVVTNSSNLYDLLLNW